MLKRVVACLAALCLAGASAVAQDYPSKPIRILVGFAPGGIVDEAARYLADYITRETGQQAIVENRTGAAGVPALGVVAKADPDGYTIAVTISGSLVISPFVQKQMPLDVTKDLALVSSLVEAPQFIAINSQLPAKTLPEFIALMKKRGNLEAEQLGREWAALEETGWLPAWNGVPATARDAGAWARQVASVGMKTSWLARRYANALGHVERRRSAAGLDEHLRTLADADAMTLEGSAALTRFITWAIPILGVLGTVLGITGAISGVTPEKLEASLSTVTDEIGRAHV